MTVKLTALTDEQRQHMTRLFPRTDTSNVAWWRQSINDRLAAVADMLRPWWLHDLGVHVDGKPVPDWQADGSREQADKFVRLLLSDGRGQA